MFSCRGSTKCLCACIILILCTRVFLASGSKVSDSNKCHVCYAQLCCPVYAYDMVLLTDRCIGFCIVIYFNLGILVTALYDLSY